MKILVTGAAGFIGSHVVDTFCRAGAEVIGLDSLDPGVHQRPPDYLRSDVRYCFADLRYWEPEASFDDVEVVVHLASLGGVSRAAREPGNILGANCLGTSRLMDAARQWPKLRRIILGSSFSVYGSNYEYVCPECHARTTAERRVEDLDQGTFDVLCPRCRSATEIQPIREVAPPSPLETYGASKYMQELCFRGFERAPVSILRFSSVYGTRLRLDDNEATIVARLAGWIRDGVQPRLYEDGRQIRDWVLVDDLVEAIVRLAVGAQAPTVMNVCSGKPTTLLEACRYLADALGVTCEPQVIGGYRAGDMRHCLGDASHLRALLGRDPIAFQHGVVLAFGPQNSSRSHRSDESLVTEIFQKCVES
ncbi:MAG: NAD-dependent epimerase/dehydratase family protein [Terriglobales bacterium]